MNFACYLNPDTKSALSRLGLNINHIKKCDKKSLSKFLDELRVIMADVAECRYDGYCELVYCDSFKNETLFKGLWKYKTNFSNVENIHKHFKLNVGLNECLLHRLIYIENILTAATANN